MGQNHFNPKSKSKASFKASLKTLVVTMAIIFVCESLVMVIIPHFHITRSAEILVDPILLALFSTPLLFAAILKPLQRSLDKQKESENEAISAREAAMMATKAKSQFLSHMSHEVRTPLNGVVGMTGLLLESELNADQLEYSETIEVCSNQMLALVNDILDISKIEAGKLELESVDFDIRRVIEEVRDIVVASTGETGVRFVYSIAPEVPVHLTGDPLRIKQILINFTSNAAKFTHEGWISLNIEVMEDEHSYSVIKCSIQDTGKGIPEHKLSDLFGEFSQIGSSTSREFGGTGLGLAINKQLVELMEGKIGVESSVGQGSTFWFTAKIKKHSEESCRAVVETETNVRSMTEEERKSTRILLADDNPINRRLGELVLKNKNEFQLETVTNGHEVLEALNKNDFDLILMDCQMPKMGGLETTRVIRDPNSNIPNRDIPIIALTGRALNSELQDCIDAGMNDCIVKPIVAQNLLNTIARHVLAGVAN